MYAITRNKEKYLCDRLIPEGERMKVNADGTITIQMTSIWQKFEDSGCAYAVETYAEAAARKDRLRSIYGAVVEVVKLTDDQVEELTFKKLKYAY